MYACRADKALAIPKVQYLIDLGAEINAVGPEGRTALHYASRGNSVKLCELLLHAGADETMLDEEGKTPLDVARSLGKKEIVQHLRNHGR